MKKYLTLITKVYEQLRYWFELISNNKIRNIIRVNNFFLLLLDIKKHDMY